MARSSRDTAACWIASTRYCSPLRSSFISRDSSTRRSSSPDVFVPELGMLADECGHQSDALPVVHNRQLDAARAEIFLRPAERAILADHDTRNSIEQHRAAAHVAR